MLQLQYSCTVTIQLHSYNTAAQLQYSCTVTIQLHSYNTAADVLFNYAVIGLFLARAAHCLMFRPSSPA